MDVLITGGNGLLGHHLVAALQDRGDSVRVLALPAEDTRWLEERGVAIYRGDIRRTETLTAPVSGVRAVLHLAGMMGVWRQSCPSCAAHVIQALVRDSCCLIHVSKHASTSGLLAISQGNRYFQKSELEKISQF